MFDSRFEGALQCGSAWRIGAEIYPKESGIGGNV